MILFYWKNCFRNLLLIGIKEENHMNKAPRYMREYASSIKKSAEGRKKDLGHVNDDVWDDTIIKADRIVRNYENG